MLENDAIITAGDRRAGQKELTFIPEEGFLEGREGNLLFPKSSGMLQ